MMKWTNNGLTAHNPTREETLAFPAIDGLRLRFRPGRGRTAKTWTWTRMVAGERPKLTLGTFPAFSIDDARKWADGLNAMVEKGINPERAAAEAAEREVEARGQAEAEAQAAAAALASRKTVRDAFDEYERDCERRQIRTIKEKRRMAEKDFLAAIGSTYLRDLTKADVRAALDVVAARGGERGNMRQRNRVRAEICATLNYAIAEDLDDLTINVAASIKKTVETRIRPVRYLTVDEMVLMIRAAREVAEDTADGWLLLALTGCRLREVFCAPFSEYRDGVWTIPASRAKNETAHPLPLGPAARVIFDRKSNQTYLFPSRRSDGEMRISSFGKTIDAITARMVELSGGEVERWRAHAIRHGFRTAIRKMRIADKETAERLINHVQKSSIDELYDHDEYMEEKEAALLAWETMLMDRLNRASGGNVVPLAA